MKSYNLEVWPTFICQIQLSNKFFWPNIDPPVNEGTPPPGEEEVRFKPQREEDAVDVVAGISLNSITV